MRQVIGAALALAGKDLRQWVRDPTGIVAGMMAPLVMLLISAIVFGVSGDAWPTGLTIEGNGPYSNALRKLVGEVSSNITPYFDIVETDAQRSRELAESGRLFMSVHVPPDFDEKIERGEPATINTYQYNVNSDMSKNTRLRIDTLLLAFREQMAPEKTPVVLERDTRRPTDVWRRTFIAGGAFTFALIVCSMLYTSINVASEWQNGTIKELYLSPSGQLATVLGKVLAGIVQTSVTASIIFALGYFLLDLRLGSNWPLILGYGLLIVIAFSCLGGLLGVLLQNIRTALPLAIILGVGTFFATGGFSSVATLPHGTRIAAPFIPTTYAFETIQALLFGLPTPLLISGCVIFTVLALVAGGLMLYQLRRASGQQGALFTPRSSKSAAKVTKAMK